MKGPTAPDAEGGENLGDLSRRTPFDSKLAQQLLPKWIFRAGPRGFELDVCRDLPQIPAVRRSWCEFAIYPNTALLVYEFPPEGYLTTDIDSESGPGPQDVTTNCMFPLDGVTSVA